MLSKTSIVIPAKNEAKSLKKLLPSLFSLYPELLEVIVVNDGSTDDTESVCKDLGALVINHKYSRGNGASVKAGARKAKGDYICFMDADGQHKPESVGRLLEKLGEGFDMVIGARKKHSQANMGRLIANTIYNYFASIIANYPIKDLTSGLRCVHRDKFKEFLHLLPNGFSYPTTITMAFLRIGYQVEYLTEDISSNRLGESHIMPLRDGVRFLIILFKIGTLYSPLKVFSSISASLFLVSFSYYVFTFLSSNTLTNMSVILFTSSLIIFLIGLVSEQINSLMYMKNQD
jgi:glycosyltransferase involved in cell wall biosynthesis